MAKTVRKLTVFMASPGDLAPARESFRHAVTKFNEDYSSLTGSEFEAVGWEDSPAQTGHRTQAVLNKMLAGSDLFILALHRRWGQSAPDSKYSSYTEEEFYHAVNLYKKGKPPIVLVFFKNVDSASEADPGPELQKVLDFRKQLKDTHQVLPRFFQTEADFGSEVVKHLRLFIEGKLDPATSKRATITLSGSGLEKSEKNRAKQTKALADGEIVPSTSVASRKQQKADLSLAKQQQSDLAMARAAVDAAQAGRLEDARFLFAKATEGTTDTYILEVAADFYRKIGDIESASWLVSRQAALTKDRKIAAMHYIELVPMSVVQTVEEQILVATLANMDPEVAAELKSVYQEALQGNKRQEILLKVMIQSYTAEEILQLTRLLASPAGQSAMQKQPDVLMKTANLYQEEFSRVLFKRHPELAQQVPEAASQDALPQSSTATAGKTP